jgi:hypothetical protein
MFSVGFHRQARHFLRGSSDRAATIVTTGHTFKRRNARAQSCDDFAVIVHIYLAFMQFDIIVDLYLIDWKLAISLKSWSAITLKSAA